VTASLAALALYPVKSCAALTPTAWPVGPAGLDHDRSWLVVDADGRFLTQRTDPALAVVRPELRPGALRLHAPGGQVDVPVGDEARQRPVEVWGFTGPAVDAGDEAAALLTEHLGRTARLVRPAPGFARPADPEAGPGVPVLFADGFPLLVASTASLTDLNTRLAQPLPMDRFRPNLVVAGAPAWAEDRWRSIRIGGTAIDLVKPCTRCAVTTVDQATGRRDGAEPLRTLATFRRGARGVLFAMNAVPRGSGTLRLGDQVQVVATSTSTN
jgi:uncharacterized protein YcbX